MALDVIQLLKNKDMRNLATYVHPQKGVRFSPYAYVDIKTDRVFKATELNRFLEDEKKYLWGYYDGSGEPIQLTHQKYYESFVYDHDYVNAREVGHNKIVKQGNTINNSKKVYPGSSIIEYHFPGFDPKYGGMDWASLRLVFEKFNNRWYLVGIIHAGWTI